MATTVPKRCPTKFRVPFQNRTLSIERLMIAILADDRVNYDLISGQALLDDPWWQWCMIGKS